MKDPTYYLHMSIGELTHAEEFSWATTDDWIEAFVTVAFGEFDSAKVVAAFKRALKPSILQDGCRIKRNPR